MTLSQEVMKRIREGEGTKPTPAAIPRPGLYWLKRIERTFYWIDATGARLDRPMHNDIYSVHTWDLQAESEWFLALVLNKFGDHQLIGIDWVGVWESFTSVISQVGPEVTPP